MNELECFFCMLSENGRLGTLIFYYDGHYPNYLAFVIDNTGSMRNEIDAVKRIIRSFIKNEGREPRMYVLATFNDPKQSKHCCCVHADFSFNYLYTS